jgi:Arylsulfotransferase (ASST)
VTVKTGMRGVPAAAFVLAVVTLALLSGACRTEHARHRGESQPLQHFRSRPDLRPPKIVITTATASTSAGYLFLAPKKEGAPGGPLIVDDRAQVVWFHPVQPRQATDFRVQRYRGRRVLTWWEGTQPTIGIGSGKFVIVDSSYRRIAEIHAGRGLDGDLHEFLITPRNTALLLAYERVPHDLSRVGGPKEGFVFDCIVQEVEIATGRVVFQWRSLDHVPVTESAQRAPAREASAEEPFDYFHANSVDIDRDGNLLVSARNTSAIYKLSRRDGRIIWRLGGRNSDFRIDPRARFAWQHDARRQPDGTLSIFDNSAIPKVAEHSRALMLKLDPAGKAASLVREYVHPVGLLSPHQGDVQRLPNGHLFVGWGGKPYVTEFDASGRVLFDAHLAVGDSYRAYRLDWTGRPSEPPTLVAKAGEAGVVTAYASWNGATEVRTWELLAGDRADGLEKIASAPKEGFETKVSVATEARYVAARALDGAGRTLGTSPAVELAGSSDRKD